MAWCEANRVDLPAEKVKNRMPLRYTLLPESGRLVEWYLATWHPAWCGPGSPWLFPAKGGGHVDSRLLTIMIKKRTRQYGGCPLPAAAPNLAQVYREKVDTSIYRTFGRG